MLDDEDEEYLTQIDIDQAYADGGKGDRNLYLNVSFDCLLEILRRESGVVAPGDVVPLLETIGKTYAAGAGHSHPAWLREWQDRCDTLADEGEDATEDEDDTDAEQVTAPGEDERPDE